MLSIEWPKSFMSYTASELAVEINRRFPKEPPPVRSHSPLGGPGRGAGGGDLPWPRGLLGTSRGSTVGLRLKRVLRAGRHYPEIGLA